MIFKRKKKKEETKPLSAEEQFSLAMKAFEKMRLADYIQYLGRPWRIIWTNVLVGVSRGIGLTLGMALVIILIVKILSLMISWKFPWLSDVSAELLELMKTTPGLEKFAGAIEQGTAVPK